MIGEPGRFEPSWDWKQRFSLDELKDIFSSLFKCDWFHEMKGIFSFEQPYEVGRQGQHAEVLLKDGGSARLEYIEARQLDWLLFNGWKFGFDIYNSKNKELYVNPLYQRSTREEALIALDLM